VEVGNANLYKEFINVSCSSIRFEFKSYCRKLRGGRRRGCSMIKEEIKVKEKRDKQVNIKKLSELLSEPPSELISESTNKLISELISKLISKLLSR